MTTTSAEAGRAERAQRKEFLMESEMEHKRKLIPNSRYNGVYVKPDKHPKSG